MHKPYQPPVQSKAGMMVDSLLMLVLVFVSLSAPLWLQQLRDAPDETSATAAEAEVADAPTWASLGQNEIMAAQWEKLGKDPSSAKPLIESRFDYSIDWVKLVLTAALIIGYFLFMLWISDREYREVIAERFGRD